MCMVERFFQARSLSHLAPLYTPKNGHFTFYRTGCSELFQMYSTPLAQRYHPSPGHSQLTQKRVASHPDKGVNGGMPAIGF